MSAGDGEESRLSLGILSGNQLANGSLQLDAVQNHVPPATETDDTHLAADPHHAKPSLSARMWLLQFYNIANFIYHSHLPLLNTDGISKNLSDRTTDHQVRTAVHRCYRFIDQY